jgi:hypothetical protein
VCELWAKLDGISLAMGQVLSAQFTVAGLVGRDCPPEVINGLRAPNGRVLSKKGRDSLHSLARGAKEAEEKVLSGVPGVSRAMASQLLERTSLSALLATPGALAEKELHQRGRTLKLGAARAGRIWRLTHAES